ncbi:MAG: hypothetical protein COY78_04225 [Candidatus Omnitrophica bacterium CG_4_10_14_0_8_um_filter_44_12]|nr:MAG: hypothetical protein COY78_04225 [Candidatus Omnitrophica bacterium CG_4_10_14_0_8_um_filter_44_12]
MHNLKLKVFILFTIAIGLFIYLISGFFLMAKTKDVLYSLPLGLPQKDKIYSLRYAHPFYSEKYIIYLRLKKMLDTPVEFYDVKKPGWKIEVNLKNDNLQLINSIVNKTSVSQVGYGSEYIDYVLVGYRHNFLKSRFYKLQIRVLDVNGLTDFMKPNIIISYPPKSGLEALPWLFEKLLLLGVAIIFLIRGIALIRQGKHIMLGKN